MMAVRGVLSGISASRLGLLHKNGRKLQVHPASRHREPKLSSEFNELGFWAMPKIWLKDWKGVVDLADEVTIKDYYWGHYDPDHAAAHQDMLVPRAKQFGSITISARATASVANSSRPWTKIPL